MTVPCLDDLQSQKVQTLDDIYEQVNCLMVLQYLLVPNDLRSLGALKQIVTGD